MSDPAGRLNIALDLTAQRIQCRIRSSRPVNAVALFAGRTVMETATLLPRLFSICGKAQAAACAAGLEQAMGVAPDPMRAAARRRIVAVETIREHLWRMLLDWPRLLGEAPERQATAHALAAVRTLFSALDLAGRLLLPDVRGASVDPIDAAPVDALERLLKDAVFGMPSQAWLDEVSDEISFSHWCRRTETNAARLMRSVIDREDAAVGSTSVPPLPDLTDQDLDAALQGQTGLEFLASPTWLGQPRETGAFARQLDQPLIAALMSAVGPGLLPRLAAQLAETAGLAATLAAPLEQSARSAGERSGRQAGVGLGRAHAARGLLVHRIELDRDRVGDYRILAPTEWNFHPQGVVAEALTHLRPADPETLRRRAELVIMATDPCVAYDLVITAPPSTA